MTVSEQLGIRRALARRASAYLREGYHCSEAVVLAVGPHLVRDWCPICARFSTGFAGGVGGSGSALSHQRSAQCANPAARKAVSEVSGWAVGLPVLRCSACNLHDSG